MDSVVVIADPLPEGFIECTQGGYFLDTQKLLADTSKEALNFAVVM